MTTDTRDSTGPDHQTITFESAVALKLAGEALEYAKGHWPDGTREHCHVAKLEQEVNEARETNGSIDIPMEDTRERRGLFLFVLSLYSQWLRDASETDGWDTPYDSPAERAATVEQLSGPFKAHTAHQRKRENDEMREMFNQFFK